MKILLKQLLSRLIGNFANSEIACIKNLLINIFIKFYKINIAEAYEQDIKKYKTFNSFFVRTLLSSVRPINQSEQVIISPCDGKISQFGNINSGRIIQAKGFYFDVKTLLTEKLHEYRTTKLESIYRYFVTIYLSPRDYHRVHAPMKMKLIAAAHIPGNLFSVNNKACNTIPNLFAKNERYAMIFETEIGLISLVMVGAILVASIKVSWEKTALITTQHIVFSDFSNKNIIFSKGDEIGYFQFGSTVILLFPKDTIQWSEVIDVGIDLKMGSELCFINKK